MDHLAFLSGPLAGKNVPLADTQIIGRGQQADLRIDDASVSREHARLVHNADGWLVVDLGSSNGTSVDGERQQRSLVRDGSVISFGAVHARLVCERQKPSAAAAVSGAPAADEVTTRGDSDPTRVLQSHHAAARSGFGADEFSQLSPLSKAFWVLVVLALSAGLFWAAYALV